MVRDQSTPAQLHTSKARSSTYTARSRPKALRSLESNHCAIRRANSHRIKSLRKNTRGEGPHRANTRTPADLGGRSGQDFVSEAAVGYGSDEVLGIHAVGEAQVDLAGVVEVLYLVWGELEFQAGQVVLQLG